ncbi:polysaccharide deacetylase family protein [Dactylosporangium sp. AC04546]|uniref:polysaccharide deacetylase family protein n=1 Tax=Dactylosporangium sp. AC04546 TaxID=2862460 RepID=UPI001EE0E9BB|nr:polysaccharide deacetylase family protein [Dactylosporangium sp. AC04546]WVK79390.1 polysaccharide deacetylase family protein [Dactylosporangium sp. AC04546]
MIEPRRVVDVTALCAAAGGALVVVAHAAPALTAITPLGRRLWPGLSGVGDPRHVALTFDDGPDRRSTPAFLDLLDRCRVRATFFLLGSMLARNPGLGGDILAAGHEVGLHGFEHEVLLRRTPAATRDDLTRGFNLIAEVCGQPPRWYRPPYGVLTAAALVTARRLGMTPVLWTTWGRDWTRYATPDSVLSTVTASLRGGGTILLRDSDSAAFPGCWKATLGALPALIHGTRRRGWTIGPLREHQLATRAR